MDIKRLGSLGPGIRKAAQHYSGSSGPKAPSPTAQKRPTPPGFTPKERTQAAGNAVKFREMARRNKTPGMTAQQANELERQSGLRATLPRPVSQRRMPKKRVMPLRKRGK
jgi:hypothetical protein